MWQINKDKTGIVLSASGGGESYTIEMSGEKASLIVTFGYNSEGRLNISRRVVFPSLRLSPNNTHASFQAEIPTSHADIGIDGSALDEYADGFEFDGVLTVLSHTDKCRVRREIFPSATNRCAVEILHIENTSDTEEKFIPPECGTVAKSSGPMGINIIETYLSGEICLQPGQSGVIAVQYSGRRVSERADDSPFEKELEGRRRLIERLTGAALLDTGNDYIDLMFRFAKIRAGESVFRTRGGYMHCPGGGSYYAAVWCNDQCEYSSPWFAYTGDETLLEAALNAYRLYTPFMDSDYRPIPSSIIAEGMDIWNGAGDRGDAAMFLFGGSQYALARGDSGTAEYMWKPLVWCAQYCIQNTTGEGVIRSDSDELEGRFSSGNTNLSTSSLTLGGFRMIAKLARAIGREEKAEMYSKKAEELAAAIDKYFARTTGGFDTYRYCEEDEDALRSWICLPLCMGEYSRAEGTIRALTSDKLRTGDGLLTREGERTYWDRSLLYALRGIFNAGYTATAFDWLLSYSRNRLTGDTVPYAIEAYPEGGKRHLSAESALYCRAITEGMFGITPESLDSFSFTPRLPDGLEHMYLRRVKAFGSEFDIEVNSDKWSVSSAGRIISSGPSDGKKYTIIL